MNLHQEALKKQKYCLEILEKEEHGHVNTVTLALVLGGIGDSHKALGEGRRGSLL